MKCQILFTRKIKIVFFFFFSKCCLLKIGAKLFLGNFSRQHTDDTFLGPVVQSVVSLTSSLRVISLTVLVESIYNILIFFAEKM